MRLVPLRDDSLCESLSTELVVLLKVPTIMLRSPKFVRHNQYLLDVKSRVIVQLCSWLLNAGLHIAVGGSVVMSTSKLRWQKIRHQCRADCSWRRKRCCSLHEGSEDAGRQTYICLSIKLQSAYRLFREGKTCKWSAGCSYSVGASMNAQMINKSIKSDLHAAVL